jgi:hypothetical protein
MNSDTAFYYSYNTTSQPKNLKALAHIAGVGSSPVVKYTGSGAYFLDKLEEGMWRLEVMPDAIVLKDPFEKASPKKEVVRLEENENFIQILLPDITSNFIAKRLNDSGRVWNTANNYGTNIPSGSAKLKPGIYIIQPSNDIFDSRFSDGLRKVNHKMGVLGIDEFYKPTLRYNNIVIKHQPLVEVVEGASFTMNASFTALDPSSNINVEIRSNGKWQNLEMQCLNMNNYLVVVPAALVTKGLISYRFIVQKNKDIYVFPGGYKGDPYAWDSYGNETYETRVVPSNQPLEIFNANTDKTLNQYNTNWRNTTFNYITTETPQQLALNITTKTNQLTGFQFYFGDRIKGRITELSSCNSMIIKARSNNPASMHVVLITKDAQSFGTNVAIGNTINEIKIPLQSFQPDSMLLLPRPYPGFLPLYFKAFGQKELKVEDVEKIEIRYSDQGSLEIETIWLVKK